MAGQHRALTGPPDPLGRGLIRRDRRPPERPKLAIRPLVLPICLPHLAADKLQGIPVFKTYLNKLPTYLLSGGTRENFLARLLPVDAP